MKVYCTPRTKLECILFATSLIPSCISQPPVAVGSVYIVDLKPGAPAPCFERRSQFETWKGLLKPLAASRITEYQRQHAISLNPGEHVRVLAKSSDDYEVKIKQLSTGRVCYTLNAGSGPGLTLFADCRPVSERVQPILLLVTCPPEAPRNAGKK